MAIVSYRLYCENCDEDIVVREDELGQSSWKVINLHYHEGLCPKCNDAVDLDDVDWEPEPEELTLENLNGIGQKAAQNLREAGYDTDKKVRDASDEELLDVSWVGEKGLESMRRATRNTPKDRW